MQLSTLLRVLFQRASSSHHEGGNTEHFCKFNNAYKVNKGHYGNVDLTGAKIWLSGDLGGDFSQGQMDWVVATFDKGTTAEQRQALGEILGARISREMEIIPNRRRRYRHVDLR